MLRPFLPDVFYQLEHEVTTGVPSVAKWPDSNNEEERAGQGCVLVSCCRTDNFKDAIIDTFNLEETNFN